MVSKTEPLSGPEGNIRHRIRVVGLVQGVGFRPFVQRQAERLGLAGWVKNTAGAVIIEAEGRAEKIQQLVEVLRTQAPPLARVQHVEQKEIACTGETSFHVVSSEATAEDAALISPDVAMCEDCRREMNDPADRRHRYPFINCTNCGPRFTIVEAVPYDRVRTTMRHFQLCPDCLREYKNVADRRFHAEPNACPLCGPQVSLLDPGGKPLQQGAAALAEARRLLGQGKILAIKGLGGFHLACDAASEEAVATLRRRKNRPHKPLAVMFRDLEAVRAYCFLDEAEAAELQSQARPILILRRLARPASGWPELAGGLAPGRGDLGLMLPYTPLHSLLLEAGAPACLVMTSGNLSEEPIVIDNQQALLKLRGIADFFLVHDRPIWNRCDDSVGMLDQGRLVLIRRSRGYVPLPIELPQAVEPTLALGAMYNNTFALASGRRLFFSQHIGDADNGETLAFLRESLQKLRGWLAIEPQTIVCDLHPDLLTTHLGRELAVDKKRLVQVQHHHAHLATALAAAGHQGEAQGLVLDGTGWGADRTVWGCELMVGSAAGAKRAAYLMPLPLPGGEAAIRRPARTAAAYLHRLLPHTDGLPLDLWRRLDKKELGVVRRMIERRFNSPLTSSAGRLFDAAAALLGVRDEISYDGQAAMELEQLAWQVADLRTTSLRLDLVRQGRCWIMDPTPLFSGLVEALLRRQECATLAREFHIALAEALAEACLRVHQEGAPKAVALCGGVFQNRLLSRLVAERLERHGLRPLLPGAVPINDAGLPLGQTLVAACGGKVEMY